jgi:N-acetylneuraminic acid mutarotase
VRIPAVWSTIRRVRTQPVPLLGLFFVVACGSSSGSPAASSQDAGSGTDALGAMDVQMDVTPDVATPPSPNGDPPVCANPGQPSSNPPALAEVAAAVDMNGTRLVLFGGDASVPSCANISPSHQYSSATYVLDVACGTWTQVKGGAAPGARARQSMALDPTANRAVLFGGRDANGDDADVWTFDFAKSAWTQLKTTGTGPSARANAAAVIDGAGNRLVVFGGNTATDDMTFTPQADTWALDLATGAWSAIATTGTKPPAREFHVMAIDRDARVAYVFSGAQSNPFAGDFVDDVWALALAKDTWSQVQTTGQDPGARIEGALAFDGPGKRLVTFAGHDLTAVGNENDIYALDVTKSPASWAKLPPGDTPGNTTPTGNCMFAANFTNADKMAPERRSAFAWGARGDGRGFGVYGGFSDCGVLADAWWWADGSQKWTNPTASPVGLTCTRVQTTCNGLCG